MRLLLVFTLLAAEPRRVTDDNGCNKGIDANNEHGEQKTFFAKTGKPESVEQWADGVRQSRKEWDEAGGVVRDERYNADGSRK